MVVGIAGKIASGKNAVAETFREKGWKIIDLDIIGHQALEKQKNLLVKSFSESILGEDRKIDRLKLSEIVYNNKKAFSKLEEIVHPVMIDIVKTELESETGDVVINAAILFQLGLHRFCDLVIWVKAPFLKRIKWLKERNRLRIMKIFKILLKQKKLSSKPWQNAVDIYYIGNKSSLDALKKETAGLIKNLADREG